jgi:hypothetical protein
MLLQQLSLPLPLPPLLAATTNKERKTRKWETKLSSPTF